MSALFHASSVVVVLLPSCKMQMTRHYLKTTTGTTVKAAAVGENIVGEKG